MTMLEDLLQAPVDNEADSLLTDLAQLRADNARLTTERDQAVLAARSNHDVIVAQRELIASCRRLIVHRERMVRELNLLLADEKFDDASTLIETEMREIDGGLSSLW